MEEIAYTETKVDRPIWEKDNMPLTKDAVEKTLQIPEHLKCPECQDLFKDAVMMPSCACTLCDECARDALTKDENSTKACPVCGEPDNSPDDLIPVRQVRDQVRKFRNSHSKQTEEQSESVKKVKEKEKMPSLPDIPGKNEWFL